MTAAFVGLDVERVAPIESPVRAVRRRLAGRYPVDPFGLDPQLADLAFPFMAAAVPVRVEGAEHVPASGAATIVANRGLAVAEPPALVLAVRRAAGRRLRLVGFPPVPVVGATFRRFGSIGASAADVGAALRAGHLVGVPLTPTWLRADAGRAPTSLVSALTHAPIVPAAIRPGGPLGLPVGAWSVRFGPAVTLDEPYDPDDPLAAARFADAMRAAVRTLLAR
ncbi:MAG: hypothetical protein ACKOBG_11030 [Actinomycetota bacterium]